MIDNDNNNIQNKSILIVDDIPENLQVLSAILTEEELEISFATNGMQALATVTHNPPDLILLDISMPEMDGFEVCKKLKADKITSQIPVIFLTARTQPEDIIKGFKSGAVDFITKPFNSSELLSRVKTHLELKISRDIIQEKNMELHNEIQERLKVEKALKNREEQLKQAQQMAKIGSLEYDYKTRKISLSENFNEILNLDNFKITDKFRHTNFFEYLHEDDKVNLLKFYKETKGTYKDFEKEFRIVDKGGNLRYMIIKSKFQFNESNKPEKFIFTFQDITQQKRNEQLKREVEIADHTAQIKQQLLANMSHEIRTPMTGIMGMSEFLLASPLNSEQRDYVSTIRKSSQSLLNIINDILSLSKLEAGKMKLIYKKFNFCNTINDVKALFIAHSKEKNIDLSIHCHQDIPKYIKADENRIKQVLTNLLSNALKFTDKGSISIKCAIQKFLENKLLIKVEVIDTGIGIDKKDQNKLFSLFSQVDASLSRNYEGAGLGLSISRELVKLMGGEIGVVSEKGKGSNFWFTFFAEKTGISDEPVKEEKTASLKELDLKLKILYVEDMFVNQKVISMMLKNAGCEVIIANNGKEALEIFDETRFDLVLMDVQMPVMDGVEAVKQLRKNYQDLPPVIGLSANALEGDAEKYIAEGMDDYLSKPVSKDMLLEKIIYWTVGEKVKPEHTFHEEEISMEENLPVLNSDTVDVIIEQASGNREIVHDIFTSFLQDIDDLIAETKKAIAENNFEAMKKAVHTIKGLCGTIGASQLHEISKKIDRFNKKANFSEAEKLIPGFLKAYDHLKETITIHIYEPDRQ